jgi:hypothetical protein
MFEDVPIADKNLYWSGLVYAVAALLLGAAWWKAIAVGLFAAICWYLSWGRFALASIGVAAASVGLAEWTGIIQHHFP